MNQAPLQNDLTPSKMLDETAAYIASIQSPDGSIAWFVDGSADPWDHIEAAMGLATRGQIDAAKNAYNFLAEQQLANGGWFVSYEQGKPKDTSRIESNFVAYIATGIWHLYLVTDDKTVLATYWPMVSRAMQLVVSLQGTYGEIYWAIDSETGVQEDALVTGCSSIFHSLGCAIAIADTLQAPSAMLKQTRQKLKTALTAHPEAFDRTWDSKARYSMDWFYPVLTGVLTGPAALAHIDQRWDEFVVDQLGCRCVNDQPWVTVAETCELVMALAVAGDTARGATVFSWIHQFRDDVGAYWTGYVFPDQAIWPEERTTWTAGAVLLAADVLSKRTAGHRLFLQP
ncbi:hypothetical protein N9Z30_00035 [Pseudomonadales bacterium]|jgi:hypothetical protein|nr:hypothetical protein [Pseudomonadales bacterium]